MSMSARKISYFTFCLLLASSLIGSLAWADRAKEDRFWDEKLRYSMFQDRPIVESDEVIELEAPYRAEDPAVVPIRIKAKIPQTEQYYIKKITLLIDKNPVPFAGRFNFSPVSGRADLTMRIRVNAYSPVRAIAETNDGKLYMSRRFVKASGGCSAPIGTDIEAALSRLGKMKFNAQGDFAAGEPMLGQLRISHPNVTGMQMDQVTRMFAPPHYIKTIKVSYGDNLIFSAETDIAISEDPSFRFYFMPSQAGELHAEVIDNTGQVFNKTFTVVGS